MQMTTIEVKVVAPPVEPLPLIVRSKLPGDLNFILNSWLVSYREHKEEWPHDFYFKHHEAKIKALFEKPDRFFIACAPDELDFIYGWLCAEAPVAHFAFVKRAFRRNGVAKSLVAAAGLPAYSFVVCSCWTPYISAVAKKYPGVFRNLDL